MSYHLNERLKGKVKMTAKHPYPDAPNSWPERDDSPYLQGGKNEGEKLDPAGLPPSGTQPMPPAPDPINRGVDD